MLVSLGTGMTATRKGHVSQKTSVGCRVEVGFLFGHAAGTVARV